jgi:hypothetical protein
MNEADTCRKYAPPELVHAGGDNEPHSFTELKTLADGRIVLAGSDELVARAGQKALRPQYS